MYVFWWKKGHVHCESYLPVDAVLNMGGWATPKWFARQTSIAKPLSISKCRLANWETLPHLQFLVFFLQGLDTFLVGIGMACAGDTKPSFRCKKINPQTKGIWSCPYGNWSVSQYPVDVFDISYRQSSRFVPPHGKQKCIGWPRQPPQPWAKVSWANWVSSFFCRVSERCVPPLEVCVGKVKLSDERFFLVEAAQACCRDIRCLSQHPKALIAGVSLDQGFWQSCSMFVSVQVFFSMLASVEGHFHFFSHHGKPF